MLLNVEGWTGNGMVKGDLDAALMRAGMDDDSTSAVEKGLGAGTILWLWTLMGIAWKGGHRIVVENGSCRSCCECSSGEMDWALEGRILVPGELDLSKQAKDPQQWNRTVGGYENKFQIPHGTHTLTFDRHILIL